MAVVVLSLIFGYTDSYRSGSKEPILSMAFESVRVILRSVRLRSLFTAFFFLYAGWMLALTYLPLVVARLYQGSEAASAIGLVLGGGGLVALVLGPLFGWLADRFGYWRMLFGGAILAVLIWPIPAFTTSLLSFGLAWGLIAGLVSGVFSISFNVLSNSAPPAIRGRVMSFAYLPVNLGFFLGPAIGSLVTRTSLFAVFPTAAVLTLGGLGLLVVAYRAARQA
jgi:MFS family permease